MGIRLYLRRLITVEGNPFVINRRKYRRMPIIHTCEISCELSSKSYEGKMVNISANGFAFSSREADISKTKGMKVTLQVPGFDVLKGEALVGHVIRISDNEGEYIVGCRMLDDNMNIYEYVEKNYKGY